MGRHYPTYALLGTNLSGRGFAWLAENYDRWVVWLDMDNAEVVRKARQLRARLSLLGPCAMIGYQPADPKHLPAERILELVEPWNTKS